MNFPWIVLVFNEDIEKYVETNRFNTYEEAEAFIEAELKGAQVALKRDHTNNPLFVKI